MELILYIIFLLFLIEHIILFIGLSKNLKVSQGKEHYIPFISIIVAARNEEHVIMRCIDSLLTVDYPKEKLEILLVNDRSTDNTGNMMHQYTVSTNHIKYLEIIDAPSKLKGKTHALSQAIKISKGELIFTTDADIEVKPSWLREMLRYYDDNTGVVNGFSIMKPNSFNAGVQSMDWIYLLSIASGSAGLKQPISCVGNNMSYRRLAYDEVGGYDSIKFSVTEDFMLLQSIRSNTKWKTKFPLNNGCLNWTLPCTGFIELYRQKKRWTKGGLDAKWAGITAGAMAWVISLAVLFGWILASIKIYIFFIFLKIIIDFLFTLPAIKIFKVPKVYLYIIPFEMYYSIYVFFAPFIALFDRKVVWKEQKL